MADLVAVGAALAVAADEVVLAVAADSAVVAEDRAVAVEAVLSGEAHPGQAATT